MPWFKIDDNFWGSTKRMACTPDAIGLWTTAGSWCSQQLTDGFVPKHVLPVLGGTARLAQKLVSVGLWEEVDDGWHFHDWSDYQPTKAAVEADRSAARERMRSRRVRRSAEGVRANTERSSESVRLPRPVPSRPSVPNGTPEETSSPATPPRTTTPPGFDEFWDEYPRRVGKQAAIKAWMKAVKHTTPAALLGGVLRLAQDPNREDQFTPHPATWLNEGRWEDDRLPARTHTARTRPSTTDAGIAAIQAMKHPQRLEIA